jgi:capsular polysaccharide biosynthesis protein
MNFIYLTIKNKWVLIEIINTNRNKEKVMHSLFLASTSWLENVCYLDKEIINAKIEFQINIKKILKYTKNPAF